MQRARTLWLAAPLLALTACAASPSVKAPPPPPSLIAPCRAPVALPDRGLSQGEVETLWGRDRSALRECGAKVNGLAAIVSG